CCRYVAPGWPEESRAPATNARRMVLVIGMSRRIARCDAAADICVESGAGAVRGLQAARSTIADKPHARGARKASSRRLDVLNVISGASAGANRRYYIMMSFVGDRLRQWLGSRLGVHSLRGFTV